MDQGVRDCTKKKYQHHLLRKVLMDKHKIFVIKLNEVHFLVVIKRILEAWTKIEPLTMVKSW